MPKQITDADLQPVHEVIQRHPDGIGIAAIQAQLHQPTSRSTLTRRLAALEQSGRIKRRGAGRSTLYTSVAETPARRDSAEQASGQFDTPDGPVTIPLSPAGRELLEYVSRPVASRSPKGYERRFLEEYEPNRTAYLPDQTKAHLHKIGGPIPADRRRWDFCARHPDPSADRSLLVLEPPRGQYV